MTDSLAQLSKNALNDLSGVFAAIRSDSGELLGPNVIRSTTYSTPDCAVETTVLRLFHRVSVEEAIIRTPPQFRLPRYLARAYR